MIPDNDIEILSVGVAKRLDVNCAVVYQAIKKYERDYHDGRRWMFNTAKAWVLQLPFLTENQIRHALERLEEAGLIVTGNYNESPFDRTKWYSTNPVPETEGE